MVTTGVNSTTASSLGDAGGKSLDRPHATVENLASGSGTFNGFGKIVWEPENGRSLETWK